MKKKILMVLALVSVALLSIGGTVAFLTDAETSTSVFTMGSVDIELRQDTTDTILMPGKKLSPNIKIANTGENDAYVWLEVAVPCTLDVSGSSANNVLHWQQRGAFTAPYHKDETYWKGAGLTEAIPDNKTWSDESKATPEKRTIDGIEYNVFVIKYNGILAPQEETYPAVYKIYLDTRVDYNEDGGYWAFVEKGVETKLEHDFTKDSSFMVTAHAIQADEFDTFEKAYAAYYNQNSVA